MLKVVLAIAALFPWSLVVAAIALARRRRPSLKNAIAFDWAPRPFTGETIEPSTREPILFDSAQIVKVLREQQR